jgi:hypothetical protein
MKGNNMSRRFLALLAAATAACASGPSSIDGEIDGVDIAVESSFFVKTTLEGGMTDSITDIIQIVLTEAETSCYEPGALGFLRDISTLNLQISTAGNSVVPPATIGPGTYPLINADTMTGLDSCRATGCAIATVSTPDDSCDERIESSIFGRSGFVTITTATATELTGTFQVSFDGGTVSGNFVSSSCVPAFVGYECRDAP